MATLDGAYVTGDDVYSGSKGSACFKGGRTATLIGGGGSLTRYKYKLRATCSLAPFIHTWVNDTGDNTNRPVCAGSHGTTYMVAQWLRAETSFDGETNVPYNNVYELDFTSQAPQTLPTDGSYTIAGVTWTKANSTGDSTALAVDGTGLRIRPGSATDYTPGGPSITMPYVYATIQALVATIDFTKALRVWLHIGSFNGAANYDNACMGFFSSTSLSTDTNWLVVRRGYGLLGTGVSSTINCDGAHSDSSYHDTKIATLDTSNNVVMMELHPDADAIYSPNDARIFYGQWTGGWPTITSMRQCNTPRFNGDFTPRFTAANTRIWLGAHRAGSGTSLDTSFGHLKIEQRA